VESRTCGIARWAHIRRGGHQFESFIKIEKNILRGGAEVARWAHNPKVVSSNLAPATGKGQECFLAFLVLVEVSL